MENKDKLFVYTLFSILLGNQGLIFLMTLGIKFLNQAQLIIMTDIKKFFLLSLIIALLSTMGAIVLFILLSKLIDKVDKHIKLIKEEVKKEKD